MVVLGATVVAAPELVSNVGTGETGLVAGTGIVTVAGANGAATGIGEPTDGVAGGAGAPKTEGAAAGAGVMTTGA